jgi:3alpha(or 20beta)-hydroxysteroid dehydrogenase
MGILEGRVAIVTGAARGMGEGITRRFVKEGARVVVADLLDDVAQSLVDELGDNAAFA